jgi:hypothetical protein
MRVIPTGDGEGEAGYRSFNSSMNSQEPFLNGDHDPNQLTGATAGKRIKMF